MNYLTQRFKLQHKIMGSYIRQPFRTPQVLANRGPALSYVSEAQYPRRAEIETAIIILSLLECRINAPGEQVGV